MGVINWKRGLYRVWIVLSTIWVILVILVAQNEGDLGEELLSYIQLFGVILLDSSKGLEVRNLHPLMYRSLLR